MRLSLIAIVVALVGAAGAQQAAAEEAPGAVWMCKPGISVNPCTFETPVILDRSLGADKVEQGGTSRLRHPKNGAGMPIDCFYVFPTMSREEQLFQMAELYPEMDVFRNLQITVAESEVATEEVSRFASRCRVYAPMYRQMTLEKLFDGGAYSPQRDPAYHDVKAAWNEYLRDHNNGRGVVIIGHSQGSFVLTRLISDEIDPNPTIRRKVISAFLPGGGMLVPKGKDVGGSFQNIPACRRPDQTACVVSYNTFSSQPPPNRRFGRSPRADREVLCVNPAALARSATGKVKSVARHPDLIGSEAPVKALPFVEHAGLYEARCTNGGGANWLQVDDVGGPDDKRWRFGQPQGPTWGLHVAEVNIMLGNLLDLVDTQSAAWLDS
jgi:hypothetical protein